MRRGAAGYCLAISAFALATAAQAGETVTYTYDALGRLVATASSAGPSSTLSYDPAGNRSSYSVSTGGPMVADGSFEEPVQASGGYTYTPTVSGASFTGGSGVAANGSAWSFAAAPDGNQAAFIAGAADGHGTVALGVSGLATGVSYAVRFHIAQRPGYGPNPVNVSFNGMALGTFTPASTGFVQLTTAGFVAGGATGTLTFDGTSTAGSTVAGIDAVTVVPAL